MDATKMTPRELLRALRRRGLLLLEDGGDLYLRGDAAVLDAFPGLREVIPARKSELLEALVAEQSVPIPGYEYRPLPGPATPWPSPPFRVPRPCSRCKRVAWPSDGAERLVSGDIVCHWCVTPVDVAAGSEPISEEGQA